MNDIKLSDVLLACAFAAILLAGTALPYSEPEGSRLAAERVIRYDWDETVARRNKAAQALCTEEVSPQSEAYFNEAGELLCLTARGEWVEVSK